VQSWFVCWGWFHIRFCAMFLPLDEFTKNGSDPWTICSKNMESPLSSVVNEPGVRLGDQKWKKNQRLEKNSEHEAEGGGCYCV
jgi:hypothetical protein